MHIKVNGETREYDAGQNVAALVAALGMNATQVAIERNRDIIPRSRWDEVALQEGDEIEIVRFIGGG